MIYTYSIHLSGCSLVGKARGWGENCLWQLAGQSSDENYVFNHEVAGSRNVTARSFDTKQRGLAQLVARAAGGREVAGSNPVSPTT